MSGSDFINKCRLFSGTLYPILGRLEKEGWIVGQWEKEAPSDLGRPRRKEFRFTGDGLTQAKDELIKREKNNLPLFGISANGTGA
jgi:DNA-binding PadR family transcriptional regulator